ncbi:DUF3152 domain-containing protein [Kineococcus gypseus]|uniref:DUF3152 domain-containing protein n=1 Tax=Kineococcus gypseus TaxID=1637102 RepID=UPI003D7C72D2
MIAASRPADRRAARRRGPSRRGLLLAGAAALAAGCSGPAQRPGATAAPAGASTTATAAAPPSPAAPPPPSTPPPPPPLPPGLAEPDLAAGVLQRQVPRGGGGRLLVVPGSSPAPPSARVRTLRVEVEADLADAGLLDPVRFADFALGVLNDPRGWGAGGTTSFARTDGDAELRLVLATPDTSAALCRPLRTMGTLSCRVGDAAVLTWYRWVEAIPDYGEDRTGYRQYVVNHEVGHLLGHGHEPGPGAGRRAPVMMQQTKGLGGALPNPWPNP